MYYFLLLLITIFAKKIFTSKKNEKLGLWLLYLSIVFSNMGIPMLNYVLAEQTINELLYYTFLTVALSIIFLLYQRIIFRFKDKFSSEKIVSNLIAIPFGIILLISIIVIEKYDNFSYGLIGIGMLFLVGSIKQYQKITVYFEQKNADRYGKSLDILSNIKGKDKK